MINININLYPILLFTKLMGQVPSQQHLEKLKSQRLDLSEFNNYLKRIKSEDDIETAIKLLLSIMTIR